jgi:hypothetical protein
MVVERTQNTVLTLRSTRLVGDATLLVLHEQQACRVRRDGHDISSRSSAWGFCQLWIVQKILGDGNTLPEA